MTLVSNRLIIKQYTSANLDDFNTILMNDTIMKGIRGKGYSREVSEGKFQEALLENEQNHTLGFYNVTNKEIH